MPLKLRHILFLFLAAIAIAVAIFCFNFFALGYSLSDLTTFFLAKDSRIQERIILQPGTSTGVSIVAGTQTDTWLSNPDDLTLPRIELNGITGKWTFKHRDSGTTTNELSSLTQALADNRYVQQNAGTGSNNTFTNPTCSGGTQSGNTELIGNYIIGTETVAKHKVQYLSDVTDYIQAQINSKENSGNHVNIIRGSTGQLMEGQIDFILEGDIFGTSTYDVGTRRGTQTIGLNPMSSSRPNILEGGSVIGTQSAEINFEETQFDLSQSTNRSNIALSTEQKGTSSAGSSNYVVRTDGTGKLNDDLISYARPIISGTSTVLTSTISSNTTTWTDLPNLSIALTPKSNASTFLLMGNISGVSQATGNLLLRLTRNNNAIGVGDAAGSRTLCTSSSVNGVGGELDNINLCYVDAPGTSSAVVYKVQYRSYSTSYSVYINRSVADSDSDGYPRAISTFTVLEFLK